MGSNPSSLIRTQSSSLCLSCFTTISLVSLILQLSRVRPPLAVDEAKAPGAAVVPADRRASTASNLAVVSDMAEALFLTCSMSDFPASALR